MAIRGRHTRLEMKMRDEQHKVDENETDFVRRRPDSEKGITVPNHEESSGTDY
jgi:hypothetical protein